MKTQFCTFKCSEKVFGINILHIKEIIKPCGITPVAHTSEKIKGLVNIRGEIHLIVELNKILNLTSQGISPDSRFILFKNTVDENFGVIVDEVGEILDVEDERIGQYKSVDDSIDENKICSGIVKDNKHLMVVVNPGSILENCY